MRSRVAYAHTLSASVAAIAVCGPTCVVDVALAAGRRIRIAITAVIIAQAALCVTADPCAVPPVMVAYLSTAHCSRVGRYDVADPLDDRAHLREAWRWMRYDP